MKTPYLIQRLQKPVKSGIFLDNPFAFGCGYKNGGLSEEAMSLIREIFIFDYMGSAEFEFGAVPMAMNRIIKGHPNIISFEILCKTKEGNTAPVYVICNKSDADDIKTYLKSKSYYEHGKNLITKESVRLQDTINNPENRVCGWLELDTGFFFFTDKEMFEKTKKLFGVK